MTIKDAEKITGLTLKSIRYYEEKGLVNIERNSKNDYRNYTEEDIERLKLIKVLRYVNFSIEDIKKIFQEDNLFDALNKKSHQLQKESGEYLGKQSLCNSMLNDCKKKELKKVICDYSDTINFLESEHGKNLQDTIIEIFCPHISSVIIHTLIFLAPIIWLFINIYIKKWDAMLLNSITAIICTGLLVFEWINYFNYRKKHKEISKTKNRKNSLIFLVLIITIILSILLFVLLNYVVHYLVSPGDYLFFETPLIIQKIIIIPIVIGFVTLFGFVFKKLKINRTDDLEIYLLLWDNFKYILITLSLIILYCFFTSNTFVTKDTIVYRDPLHPLGIKYKYSDVTKIETGFGRKNFSFNEYNRKGQFYYRIYFNKRKITFSVPMPNPEIQKYEDDSYLELEEFDNELKKYNINKISDGKYALLCDLDKEYCDRFVRIVNN